ncbi:MAG: Exosortase/archaeosortase family protein [Frankiales bacterium]|nr:Exosortase/archaeosortase family protein [Frankiales bacterium]
MTSLSLPSVPRWSMPEWVKVWASRNSFGLRLTASLVAIAGAYHYSLMTLVRALGLETPLAYLGLVPIMALGLALLRARPALDEPTIHDRQVDVIVAIPLLAAAVLIVTALPARMSSLFWVWRVDLLSMPFFVAAVVTLIFGVRALWRLRVAIGFLLLAWPLPYTAFLSRWLDGFTGLTISALKISLQHWHVGAPAPGSDGSLFALTHGGKQFVLSVASSCSGVNGVVGFLLVGVAFTSLVRGRRPLKLLWLASGIGLIWLLNVLRLLIIFWAGSTYGERFAIDGLHPVIGLVLFCAGIAVMALTMPLFRLTVPVAAPRRAAADVAAEKPADRPADQPYHRLAVPRAKGAVILLLATALFMGVANAGMRQYQLVAGDLGAARLASFTTSPAVVPGYAVANVASYPWSKRFFGGDSTWLRYSYYSTAGLTSSAITADVVSTTALGRFSDYGIEACYKFHGYDVSGERSFDLGGGVTGSVLTYHNAKQHMQWNVVYWIWPVKSDKGNRFERVVLLMPGKASVRTMPGGGPEPRTDPVSSLGQQSYAVSAAARASSVTSLDAGRRFLVDFARDLVRVRPGATATKTSVSAARG